VWSYIKSKRQEPAGISPLLNKDWFLHSDSHIKAEILNHQFQSVYTKEDTTQGRIQDFKLGGALKKIEPSGGRRENRWGISCEKSRFDAKKSYFFQSAPATTLPDKGNCTIKSMNDIYNSLKT
jgi:hypothetical protein